MPTSPAPRRTPTRAALSPSRAKDFEQCPLMFRLRVVDRLPEPPSPAATRGTVVHSVLERLYDQPAPERTEPVALSLVDPAWQDIRTADSRLDSLFTSPEDADAWMDQVRALVSQYFRMENPRRLEPAGREMHVEAELGSGVLLRGIVDRLDRSPAGATRVVDYKTGKSPSARFAGEATFQLMFYGLVLWRSTGVAPSRLQIVYLADGRTLTVDPEERDLLAAEERIEQIWGRIEEAAVSGVFPPRPSKLCPWCSFQDRCPQFGGEPPELPATGIERLLTVRRA
ncbi:RecB family exonuclease [Georgenia sp. Z1344]|uniref:RecB family exonuclease n=1 Tax=Georgenia sp. Z1344 TaxID=3416706 RepID=UPI003CF13BF4